MWQGPRGPDASASCEVEKTRLSGVGEAKAALTPGWFPTASSVSRDLGRPGAIGQRAEASASSLPCAPGGPCPGLTTPWLLFCFAPPTFRFASHPSMPLIRHVCPPPPVLTLIPVLQPCELLSPLPRSGQAEPDPRPTKSGAPGLCTPFCAHVRLSPSTPSLGPHLARCSGFPGCKSASTAPWHLLRFQLQESLSWGGGGAPGGGGSAGPSLYPAAAGRRLGHVRQVLGGCGF